MTDGFIIQEMKNRPGQNKKRSRYATDKRKSEKRDSGGVRNVAVNSFVKGYPIWPMYMMLGVMRILIIVSTVLMVRAK